MRTRRRSKQSQSTGEEEVKETRLLSDIADDNKTLSNISGGTVAKPFKSVNKGSIEEDDVYLRHCESESAAEGIGLKENNEELLDKTGGKNTTDTDSCKGDAIEHTSSEVKGQTGTCKHYKLKEEYDDSDWEDGSIPTLSSPIEYQEDFVRGVSLKFDVSPGLSKRKFVRRATSQEKEVAEVVHKCHLLCMLGRGRLIDRACNDPLIQASLLSLLPAHLQKIAESPNLTASHLSPLVNWFHNQFSVCSPSVAEKTCHGALASTLETREGTPEAIVALCVALFRALNLTTRFVSILDAISLKPDADKWKFTAEVTEGEKNIFNSSTLMVGGPDCSSAFSLKSFLNVKGSGQTAAKSIDISETDKSRKHGTESQVSQIPSEPKKMLHELVYKTPFSAFESCDVKVEGLKRKGDLEFQLQLEMALSATAVESFKHSMTSNVFESPSTSSTHPPPYRRMKRIKLEESQTSLQGISTAIGTRMVGAHLYWAEIFCAGDNMTGKWVHVDVINAIVDGEDKVEAAAAVCKTSLRYVVAFHGNGAKDVTRRYCTQWYKLASQRINPTWWDSVLAQLKEYGSGATGGTVNFVQKALGDETVEPSLLANLNNRCIRNDKDLDGAYDEFSEKKAVTSIEASFNVNLSFLEDMELATRALIEPLPTNQLAYKNHHLYVIEKWLKKYQIIYPKWPVLGFCSGHAVYPRTCVQMLRTRQMWLHEGMQVKADELPAKVLKCSTRQQKREGVQDNEYAYAHNEKKNMDLYGRWQTERLLLPRPVNGVVPKNDSVKYHKRMETDRVFVFLAGLNRELDEVRGRILGRMPLPSLGEVFAEVRREEGRRRVMLKEKSSSVPDVSALISGHPATEVPALVSRNIGKFANHQSRPGPKGEGVKCEYCNKPNHTKETCWDLHGKPPNWKPRFQKQKGRESRAHQSGVEEEAGVFSGMPTFSKEQLGQLYRLLQSPQFTKPVPVASSSSVAQQGFGLGDDDWQC
ncbi:DNA repair protein complementing XP-C cell [Dorcoceras hygrometricum]|uniref:DNA repair protein complementing XP-C cell n=1 Tax=Dorcoceras hygrometricum TaxID=472368 RepID=A0A2Z7C7B6_9LAMI|nr:DNA repair protein complementing XP-C cell [Dorcoceras hygrometricum]